MREVFVDTSAYFALTDSRDENHEAAVQIIHQLIRDRAALLTTNYIVAETHTLLLNRIGYTTALLMIEELYKSQTRIYRVREAEERKAIELCPLPATDYPVIDDEHDRKGNEARESCN